MMQSENILLISAALMDQIKVIPSGNYTHYINGFKVQVSHALPFNLSYDACDIETKEEVKILGEEVNAVMVPKMDYCPTIIQSNICGL